MEYVLFVKTLKFSHIPNSNMAEKKVLALIITSPGGKASKTLFLNVFVFKYANVHILAIYFSWMTALQTQEPVLL